MDDWNGLRVGLYTRLSQDRDGTATSVQRQDGEAREYAEGRGAVVVGTWSDPDASAYDERVRRPGFDALLEAARAGEIDGVAVWALDRLTRQPAQIEQVISLMRKSGLRLLSVKEGEVDTSAGALVARFLTWRAEAESERISQRVKSANRKAARDGKAHTGGPRPWGHERGCRELRDDEAEQVREAARRVIAGESLYGIAADWRSRGLTTPAGRMWSGGNLGKMLNKPRLAGYRERDGELHRSDPADGGIVPILDDEVWQRVRAILADPIRKRPEVRTTRHLLSGLLRCGGCGSRMVAGMSHGRRVYKCQPANVPGACGKVSIAGEAIDEVVAGAWVEAFDGPDSIAAVATMNGERTAAEAELHELRERLTTATRAHFVEGVLPRAGYLDAKAQLDARIADVERELRRDDQAAQAAELIGRADGVWDGSSLSERRGLLRLIVAEVQVAPRGKTGRFDPARVSIDWRA